MTEYNRTEGSDSVQPEPYNNIIYGYWDGTRWLESPQFVTGGIYDVIATGERIFIPSYQAPLAMGTFPSPASADMQRILADSVKMLQRPGSADSDINCINPGPEIEEPKRWKCPIGEESLDDLRRGVADTWKCFSLLP